VCPQGDAPALNALPTGDATIFLRIRNDIHGAPIPGISASDFWLNGCENNLILCGGGGAIDADSATNSDGRTTISGSMAASGCDIEGVWIVVQGVILMDPQCTGFLCLPITTVSPDVPGALDGKIDLLDLTAFAFGYTSPPKLYEPCFDFNCDSQVDLLDFSVFGFHFLHRC
jgi:hypothetical protein